MPVEEAKGEESKKREVSVSVPFHKVQSFVPNNYYKQVHEDN